MDILLIYLYIAALLALLIFVQKYIVLCLKFVFNPRLGGFITRHVVLPYLLPRWYLWGPLTRLQALLHCFHLAGTLTCNILGVSSLSMARSRAGTLAVFHLVPLALTPRLSMGAKFIDLSLASCKHLHSTVGLMATFQSILHVVFSYHSVSFDLSNRAQRHGFIATISIASLTLMAVPWIRRRLYEIFSKSHFALGALTIVMVWMHLKNKFNLNAYLLIASLGIYSLSSTINLTLQLYRNMMAGKFFAVAKIAKTKDAVELSFRPRRPWKVYAGQYIYLKAPGVRLLSIAESHPFNIIWWENGPDGKAESISVLAKVQSGFTKELLCYPGDHLKVLIDGPYGVHKDTGPYDSIIMICTGIGITAHLPYAKEIILHQMPNNSLYRKQRVTIIWIMEKEYHSDWVCDWMDRLLAEDSGNAKNIRKDHTLKVARRLKDVQAMQNASSLEKQEITETVSQLIESAEKSRYLSFNYSLFITEKSGKDFHIGRRGVKTFGKPDLRAIIDEELSTCYGKLLISISANSKTRDLVRGYASTKDMADYYETEFQPSDNYKGFWAPSTAERANN